MGEIKPASEAAMTGEPTSWRDRIKVHPAGDLFEMMPYDELVELGNDIKAHGLRQPIVFWTEPAFPQGDLAAHRQLLDAKGNRQLLLLDGRNRLAAAEIVGLLDDQFLRLAIERSTLSFGEDPYAFVISANLRRRHLTAAQKREVIKEILKARPERSDRGVAGQVKVSPTTVGEVRRELEQRGMVSRLDTRTGSDGVRQPATKPPTPPKPPSKETQP